MRVLMPSLMLNINFEFSCNKIDATDVCVFVTIFQVKQKYFVGLFDSSIPDRKINDFAEIFHCFNV